MKNKLKRYYARRHDAGRYAKWLWKAAKRRLPAIILISVINGIFSAIGIGIAAFNKGLVDQATGASPRFGTDLYLMLVVVTLGNLSVRALISVFTTFLNEKFSFSMRQEFYAGILKGDWLKLSGYHSGNLMTRLTGDIDTVSNGLFTFIPSLFYISFQFIMALLLLYHYDPGLTLFAVCMGPAGLLVSVAMFNTMKHFQRQMKENEGEFRSFMQESMENLMVVKTFCCEALFEEQIGGYWRKRFEIIKRKSKYTLGINIISGIFFSGGYLLAFGWSLLRLSKGEITYGTVTLLLTLVSQIQAPINNLRGVAQQLVGLLVSAGRLMEVMEIPRETLDGEELRTADAVGVRAEQVCFSYTKEGALVLNHLNFDIRPGETVGIVGESGAGKTTVVRLLLALAKPSSGELSFYSGAGDRAAVSPATRSMIAYVPQGNTLLSGSIRSNLCLGRPEADDGELWEALKTAEAAEFVRRLPRGLDSLIQEKGGAVSEGQAQRLAIARAVLRRSPILILDEATASLDMDTEKRIVSNLQSLAGNLTCIIVTHRPSLLGICQRTFLLKDGEMTAAP